MTTTHGMYDTKLYRVYRDMKTRCYNKNDKGYKDYGGRGITICDEWLNDKTIFFDWAKPLLQKGLQIDRIDNDKGYSPENCRFATRHVNSTNQRKQSNNKSGYVGISWDKINKKWYSQIQINNKTKNLGRYDSKHDALNARNDYIRDNKLSEYKEQQWKGE